LQPFFVFETLACGQRLNINKEPPNHSFDTSTMLSAGNAQDRQGFGVEIKEIFDNIGFW